MGYRLMKPHGDENVSVFERDDFDGLTTSEREQRVHQMFALANSSKSERDRAACDWIIRLLGVNAWNEHSAYMGPSDYLAGEFSGDLSGLLRGDRDAMIVRLVEGDYGLSNRAIAELMGVSHPTVANALKAAGVSVALSSTGKNLPVETNRATVGKDGKSRKARTAATGKNLPVCDGGIVDPATGEVLDVEPSDDDLAAMDEETGHLLNLSDEEILSGWHASDPFDLDDVADESTAGQVVDDEPDDSVSEPKNVRYARAHVERLASMEKELAALTDRVKKMRSLVESEKALLA